MFKITLDGGLTTIYDFCSKSGCADGQAPYAGLVQAPNGDFFGTTLKGGIPVAGFYGSAGTIYKISPSGTLTTLYSFCSQAGCTGGSNPYAGLIRTADGDFYGTTYAGGTGCPTCGTVFKITPEGSLTTMYSFDTLAGEADGAGPYAGLFQGANGDFYGTTLYGGSGMDTEPSSK